jgi:hypothetical protein
MKKVAILAVGAALLMSSCGSYMASGAYAGSSLGSILGSAIGGLTNGPRGSDWGSIIGMAGGAVVGGAIGNAVDKAQQERLAERYERMPVTEESRQSGYSNRQQATQGYDSGFSPDNLGDDRIEFDAAPPASSAMGSSAPSVSSRSLSSGIASVPSHGAKLVISNVVYNDQNDDNVLKAGEVNKISFDLKNMSSQTIYNVQPQVLETTGNRHVLVSPSILVESIAPGSGIRYTATVVGDRSLRKGMVCFEIRATAANGVSAAPESIELTTSRR